MYSNFHVKRETMLYSFQVNENLDFVLTGLTNNDIVISKNVDKTTIDDEIVQEELVRNYPPVFGSTRKCMIHVYNTAAAAFVSVNLVINTRDQRQFSTCVLVFMIPNKEQIDDLSFLVFEPLITITDNSWTLPLFLNEAHGSV